MVTDVISSKYCVPLFCAIMLKKLFVVFISLSSIPVNVYAIENSHRSALVFENTIPGSAYGGPTPVLNGTVMLFVNKNNAIEAIKSATGKSLWSIKLSTEANNRDTLFADDKNELIAFTFGDMLYAVNAKTGKLLWQNELSSITRGSPLITDDEILVYTIANETIAFSRKDGSKLWNKVFAVEAIRKIKYLAPLSTESENVIIIPSPKADLRGFTKFGEELWLKKIPDFEIASFPVTFKDSVIVSGTQGDLEAYSSSNGTRIWKLKYENPLSLMQLNKSHVVDNNVIAYSGESVLSIDGNTGNILEKYTLTNLADSGIRVATGDYFNICISIPDSKIAIISRNGLLFLLDENLKIVGNVNSIPISHKELSEAYYGSGYVYIRFLNGDVFRFNIDGLI